MSRYQVPFVKIPILAGIGAKSVLTKKLKVALAGPVPPPVFDATTDHV